MMRLDDRFTGRLTSPLCPNVAGALLFQNVNREVCCERFWRATPAQYAVPSCTRDSPIVASWTIAVRLTVWPFRLAGVKTIHPCICRNTEMRSSQSLAESNEKISASPGGGERGPLVNFVQIR